VNCEDVRPLLSPEADGEIDRLRSHAIRRHAARCPTCSARQQALQALREQMRTELPRYAAPAALRARVRHAFEATVTQSPRATRPALRWGWFGGGVVSGALGVSLLWMVSLGLLQTQRPEDLSVQIVGMHTRATLGNNLIEVASSDRHKVKPWLSARLDYSIPVTDWSGAGFPLVGARIERLEGKPVATLVYKYRDHVIDVFVRPEHITDAVPALHAVRGFNVAVAKGAGMQWLATSDLNGAELAAFIEGLAQGSVKPPS
jgi:anti-sigma factor RsiW